MTWNVYIGYSIVDTVYFDSHCSRQTVEDTLINHDGYPAIIAVRAAK